MPGVRAQASCCTCIMVAVSGHIVAVLAVTDPLKPEARGVVRSPTPFQPFRAEPPRAEAATFPGEPGSRHFNDAAGQLKQYARALGVFL